MTTFYRRHPGLRLTGVEDEGIVLHLDTRRHFSVNETGLLILDALNNPQSAELALLAAGQELRDAIAGDAA